MEGGRKVGLPYDLRLGLSQTETQGKCLNGPDWVFNWRLAGQLELFLLAKGILYNACDDIGEVFQAPIADVFEPGQSRRSLGNQPIGADQPVKEGLDAEGQQAHLTVGEGNTGHDFIQLAITGIDPESLGIFGYLDQEHPVIKGILYMGGGVESMLEQVGQDLHVVQGPVSLGEHGPEPVSIEAAKESVALLVLLLNPVVEVAGLQIFGTAGEVGIGQPQTIGQQALGTGGHIDRFAGHPHAGQAVEFHFLERDGFVKMIDGLAMNHFNDVFE